MLSLRIIFRRKNKKVRSITNEACFGAGCFWGTEKFFRDDFGAKFPSSNIIGQVGYMGPKTAIANPSYSEVCSGKTGHVEVYRFTFDGNENTYEELVRFFYTFHNPTTLNEQGNDRGTQYASVIYCYDDDQKQIAKDVTKSLQQVLDSSQGSVYRGGDSKVRTDIRDATVFYPATSEHQEYLRKNPWGYCNHKLWFEWPKGGF